jgi:hypothetical protein
MLPHRPDPAGTASVSRRAFLGCCSALALAAAGCAGVSTRTRAAYVLASDPPLAQYEPILDALVGAFLPCERSEFPLTAGQVRARLLTLFSLERDPRFLDLQKAVVYFDQTDLFAEPLVPRDTELIARDVTPDAVDADAIVREAHARDAAAYAALAITPDGARFVALPLDRQRAYLNLWRASAYSLRRQFHASARSLVMISAYSSDAMWPVIGYDGPLLPRERG